MPRPLKTKMIILSELAIAWFWFMGAAVICLISFCDAQILPGGNKTVLFFIGLIGIGLVVGGILSDRLGVHRTEPGLIPLGSIGMSLFAFDLFWAMHPASTFISDGITLAIRDFLTTWAGWRISIDIFLFAVSAGLFVLPLYSFIKNQKTARSTHRFLCGHHLFNLLFAVIAICLTAALSYLGLAVRWEFLLLAAINILVTVYIYHVIPEFFFRFLCFVLSRIIYRVSVKGLKNLPEKGPAALVCNHVTFVDWMIIAGACPRPVRFVMDQAFLNIPFTGRIFRDGKVIPITTGKKGPKLLKAAFEKIALELETGNIVCIFPEGKITRSGELSPFKPGIERIVTTTPVPVIPMALNGLWGSFFSRKYGRAMSRPFKRFRSKISLEIGSAIAPEKVTAPGLQIEVDALCKDGNVCASS